LDLFQPVIQGGIAIRSVVVSPPCFRKAVAGKPIYVASKAAGSVVSRFHRATLRGNNNPGLVTDISSQSVRATCRGGIIASSVTNTYLIVKRRGISW